MYNRMCKKKSVFFTTPSFEYAHSNIISLECRHALQKKWYTLEGPKTKKIVMSLSLKQIERFVYLVHFLMHDYF